MLWTAGPNMKARPDVEWDPHEAESNAAGLRVALEVVLSLGLKRRWPGLAVDWLPSTDGSGRARGELDLAWCRHCLAEAHEAGGAYLEAEAALPLVFCHRHGAWRQDYCRRCRPKHAPRFTWLSSIEFVCGDCGTSLRASRWEQPTPAVYFEPGDCQEFCAGGRLPSLDDEALTEDYGELTFGLTPFARWALPFVRRVIEHEI